MNGCTPRPPARDQPWPKPSDTAAAAILRERFAALGRAEARFAASASGVALLDCIGGNSPFLSDLALRDPGVLRGVVARGPDAALAEALAALVETDISGPSRPVADALRRAKRTVAMVTAVTDLGGIWTVEQVTGALSALADAALALAVDHLLRAAHDRGLLRLRDPAAPSPGSGFVVLGMGKLGARELNYSSDVDLILLYDPSAGIYADEEDASAMGAFFSRLARDLVAMMEVRDGGGYVFRVDLRLRPDPAATPPAIALPGALTYYESMGQNWERAAMVKARPVAGDIAAGAAFIDAIRPFVWRRGLDFAAVADIHAMKRRIDEHRGGSLTASGDPLERIAGHNVKLGEGGIREIEFLVQTLQLVWGGRDPQLRAPRTLDALHDLAAAGRIGFDAVDDLSSAYRFLRTVEHRLQMTADRQTHALPARKNELERFAVFMGFADGAAFAEALLGHLGAVRLQYARVFGVIPDQNAPGDPALDFRGDDPEPAATVAALRAMGFQEIRRIVDAVRGWQSGRIRALRSARARELLDPMLPGVLAALARQAHPDEAFGRLDTVLSRLPAGVQLLSLFQRNPKLIERIAAILGAAPSLADHLSRYPASLDGLLALDDAADPERLLRRRLRDARAIEDAIAIVRRTVREEDFALSVATMEGRLDVDAAGRRRTALAEAAVRALLPRAMADFVRRHGRVRGGGMAVVMLGKAGGREMMAGSDLDLMLIYDHPEDAMESRGGRPLAPSQYFVRAAHALVGTLTTPGQDGPLYAVDMRLRPSGNKGPVAVSLAGFERYHRDDAWTWERMALTRARVVAGPPALQTRVTAAIRAALLRPADPAKIRADAASMRARLEREHAKPGSWTAKQRAGGQIDVAFAAQTLQLIHASAVPGVLHPNTATALYRLHRAGFLGNADAALLIEADRAWRTLEGMIRILVGRTAGEALPEPVSGPLLDAMRAACVPAVDLPGLRATLDALAEQVRSAFVRLVGETGG